MYFSYHALRFYDSVTFLIKSTEDIQRLINPSTEQDVGSEVPTYGNAATLYKARKKAMLALPVTSPKKREVLKVLPKDILGVDLLLPQTKSVLHPPKTRMLFYIILPGGNHFIK